MGETALDRRERAAIIEIRRIWRHRGETDAVHLMLIAGEHDRHIKLKRAGNRAMYDFIVEYGAIATDPQPDVDPDTAES